MDYPCAKALLVLSCGQTNRITDADDRYIHATIVGVSNELTKTTRLKSTLQFINCESPAAAVAA